MLNKIKKSRSDGFTIIEVMIVLAIAALILLIVLLAVPALQRNSRNTQIKNDASAVVSAVNEYVNNNDGALPGNTGTISSNGTVTFAPATGSAANSTAKVQSSTTVTATTTAPSGAPATGTITVVYKYKCTGTNYAGTGDITGNNRSTVVLYSVEGSGSGSTGRCIDS